MPVCAATTSAAVSWAVTVSKKALAGFFPDASTAWLITAVVLVLLLVLLLVAFEVLVVPAERTDGGAVPLHRVGGGGSIGRSCGND